MCTPTLFTPVRLGAVEAPNRLVMAPPAMESTVAALIASGKGILAADESSPAIEKRFKALNLASAEENRHTFRELPPANFIQARRDYFGAHTYGRIDAKGTFHTEWEAE